MKVDIVGFVENEMVELDVAQIGWNWGWSEDESEDESEFGSVERGDACGAGYAKKFNFTNLLHPPLHHSLHHPNNQSKPIVSLLSFSFIITFSYIVITISYNL